MGHSKRDYWQRIHSELAPMSEAGRKAYIANNGISAGAYEQARYRYGFSKKQKQPKANGGTFKQFVAAGTEPMVMKLPNGCEIRIPSGDVASLRAVVQVCGGDK